MKRKLFAWASWLVAGILLIFSARRWLFMLVALLPDKAACAEEDRWSTLPDVLLLVPVRNELEILPELLSALRALEYPEEQLTLVIIDDGSTDGSTAFLRDNVAGKGNWHVLSLEQSLGKADALNHALAACSPGDIVAIFDADERPRPDALKRLVHPFEDRTVGGVSGRRAVANPLASPAASYVTFEGLVHQLVTMRAKHRLHLAPALLGSNCAYRRAALAQAGNFRPGVLLEDSDLTIKLSRAGWCLRFEPRAVSYHHVPTTMAGYWRQHIRWARGFNDVAKMEAKSVVVDGELSLPLRLELLIFSLGYLDRLALLVGGVLLIHQNLKGPLACLLPFNLVTPFFQILAALKIGRAPAALWSRLAWVPVFFVIDLAMAVTGFWHTLRHAPAIWEERQARL